MTRTFDLSGKLPEDIVTALATLDQHFRAVGVHYVVIGALARDAVTSYAQGNKPSRATKDIDLAVRVVSMQHFREVTRGLDALGEHTFFVGDVEVDLVPFFGDDGNRVVEFESSVLDTIGLADAAAEADSVLVRDGLSVSAASVGALCLLKVLAWRDRRGGTKKDATDLKHLFAAVNEGPYEADAWSDETAGEIARYDGSLIGAAWLGLEAGRLARPESRAVLLKVLAELGEDLAADMGGPLAREQLAAFMEGVRNPGTD